MSVSNVSRLKYSERPRKKLEKFCLDKVQVKYFLINFQIVIFYILSYILIRKFQVSQARTHRSEA